MGAAIANLSPTVTGNVASYSISPALPAGLSFDTATGVISGTPTTATALATYVVTAVNTGGNVSFPVVITVNDLAPSALSYTSPNVYTVGTAIANLTPTVTGNVTGYTVSPALPDGLSIDALTGAISGIPTVITELTTYVVTAANTGGSVSFPVVITINDAAPTGLLYDTPNVFTVNASFTLVPLVQGNVTGFTLVGTLPSGVTFDQATGIISGAATTPMAQTSYTVTAGNSGGTVSFTLTLEILDLAPAALSYQTPNVYTVGTAITDLTPTVTGNVTSYTVSPALPDGLSIDALTGVISGTPSTVTPEAAYTVTATNSGGSVSFDVVITVDEPLASAEFAADRFAVYPNPFSDRIEITGMTGSFEYSLFSADGKQIKQGRADGNIALPDLPNGLYLLRVSSADATRTVKLIKR